MCSGRRQWRAAGCGLVWSETAKSEALAGRAPAVSAPQAGSVAGPGSGSGSGSGSGPGSGSDSGADGTMSAGDEAAVVALTGRGKAAAGLGGL